MRTPISILVSGLIVALTSCGGMSKALVKPKNNLETIPADFNPEKHILLVAEMPKPDKPDSRHNGVTKKLDKQLKKVYPYPYEIVSMKDILNYQEKYSDSSKYKYAMVSNVSSYTRTTTTTRTVSHAGGSRTTSTSPSARIFSIDFRFYDRFENKAYPLSGNSSSYFTYTIPAIVETIHKARKGNSSSK